MAPLSGRDVARSAKSDPLSPPAFTKPLATLAGYGWQASESGERPAEAVHRSGERSERSVKATTRKHSSVVALATAGTPAT